MKYKNIIIGIVSVLIFIFSIIFSNPELGSSDYSYLNEYAGNDKINIATEVKIENIDELYFYDNGSYNRHELRIKSIKTKWDDSNPAEFIFTYNGKRLYFDYEIVVLDFGLITQAAKTDKPAKLKIISKENNIFGNIDIEIDTYELLREKHVKKILPTLIGVGLSVNLLICIIFVIVDYKKNGYFDVILSFGLKKHSNGGQNSLTNSVLSYEQRRLKEYEEKYDLTKKENAVFKEIAYGTIDKLFVDDIDDENEENISDAKNL